MAAVPTSLASHAVRCSFDDHHEQEAKHDGNAREGILWVKLSHIRQLPKLLVCVRGNMNHCQAEHDACPCCAQHAGPWVGRVLEELRATGGRVPRGGRRVGKKASH
eukprot:scaffold122578_cov21-Tisochrysis_lutea.AAC.1